MSRRGGVYQGSLQGADRILLVLSNDEANSVFNHVVVAWVLTGDRGRSLAQLRQAVDLEADRPTPGAVFPHLLQTVPAATMQAMRYLGQASPETMYAVEDLLLEILNLA